MSHMQRDHLFNRSTRPLLEVSGKSQAYPQVKKKSAKEFKVHGFNDFNFVANQYRNLNANISYPYGSPPASPSPSPPPFATTSTPLTSKTIMHTEAHHPYDIQNGNKVDFIFSDDSGIHVNNISSLSTSSSTNYYEDIDNSYQLSPESLPPALPATAAAPTSSLAANAWNWNRSASERYYQHRGIGDSGCGIGASSSIAPSATTKGAVVTSKRSEHQQRFNQIDDNGPFIFGVHSNNCNTNKPMATAKLNERNESVINNTTAYTTKYSSIVTKRMPENETCHDSGDVISHSQKKDQRLSEKGPNRTKKDKRQTRNAKKHAEEIKCVLVGDGMVGKTNLIMSYLENRFTTEHVPTASDIYNCEVKVDDLPVQITLCDTAGQDFFDPLRRLCYPDSDVFLLCFSVVKPKTFKSVQNKWAPNLSKSRASIVLIGTQADLRSDTKTIAQLKNNNELPVSKSDAWDYATSIGAKYIETSSRSNKGVKDAFDTAIWDAMMTTKRRRTPSLWKRIFCIA